MSDVPNGTGDTPGTRRGRRLPVRAACSPCNGPSGCSSSSRRTAARCRSRRLATASGLPPADPAPAGPHARRPRLPAPGTVAALRPRAAPVAAGRALVGDAQRRRRCRTWATWSTRSARRPTSPCSTETRWPTSRRCRGATRCGCSPRSAAASQPHCTAVGKALLAATRSDEEVRALLGRTGLPRHTPHTVIDPDELLAQLAGCATRGYALDEGEQEVGVRCVAVDVPGSALPLAISVSGPAPRMTDELLAHAVPVLRDVAARLAAELS